MSAQSAKKKRFGSRRRAANQNEISKGDEFHTTDSTFVAQYHIPEENTESLNEVASPDNSQSETQPLPSPELSGNRRKLGSSRRNKRQHVKDSETESHHNPREEVEEKTRGEETTETKQMSLVIQHKRQEELSQGAVDDMSATHDESLYSAVTPSEVQNSTINYAEADLESLIPKSENLQVDQDENETNSRVVSDSCKLVEYMQKGNDKSDTLHSEDVKESEHLVGISELTTLSVLSCPTVDPQLIDQLNSREMPEEKFPNMYSTTEKDSNERDDNIELLKQDGNLQGNFLVSESHVESVAMQFSTTPVITTEKMSSRENTDTECSVWQAAISTAEEVLHTDEEQNEHFNLSEVKGDHQSEDAENKVREQKIKPTEIHEITSEMLIHDATENPENLTDQTDMSGTQQPEFVVKITDDCLTSNEISSSDSKQDEHHTDESNAEALEEKNEDYHVYHTKKPPISNKERVDTVLGQVYEMEGQVEDDIKLSVEQTGHQEKDRLFYEMEESESPLRTLKSEINSPFDSQHQQNDTDFNPLGNRRKLGSSRRNKGRQHVKDPDAESYHKPAEDVVGNTRDNEPLETTEMSLTIKTAMQGKTNETMLEGINKFDTTETEDVGDQVKENALCTDIQLPSSCSVTERKERDENTELLKQWGILQSNDLVSEGVESSIASEITTDNHDPREHTEPECSVEQALFSLPKEESPTNEEQNEHFNLSEVRGDHQSEDAESKVHEQEIKPTEMPQTEYSSEMLIHDATENPEITSGNLTDQTEVSDTHQSELSVNGADDSPFKQDISNPDDKEDERPMEESNFETLEQNNEDYHVYDTKKAPISDIERVDTAQGQVYEMGSRLEDDINPSDEQRSHQEKEGHFDKMEVSESSLQTLQSEINAPFDSQHHTRDNEPLETTEMSLTIETAVQEKTNETMLEGTDKFNTAETEDVSDQVKEKEHGGTHIGTDVPLSSTVDQQTIDQSNIREMPDDELTNVCSVTERKERDENTELLKQWGILQSNDLMSEGVESSITSEITTDKHDPRKHTEPEYSVEQALFSLPKEELPTNEEQNEHFNLSEVNGDHQSEDAESKVHEQEIKPTEMLQTEHSSEMLIHDATENPEIISENLTDQTEVSDTHQSEWVAKSANDSPLKQDISNPDNQQDEHHTKESNFEVLEQKKEDNHAYDIKTPPISGIERVDTALSQVYEMEGQLEDDVKPSDEQTGHQKKEGLLSEMEESESSLQTLQSEINSPFDSQHQQNETGLNPLGNRRKLGSSRRNKGRRHVKDSHTESHHTPSEDVVGNTRDNEPLETTEMSLTTETAMQGKTNETMLEGINKFDTAETEDVGDQVKENALGTDIHSSSTEDQQTIDQLIFREMPDKELPDVCFVPEKESKDRDEDTELLKHDGNLRTNLLVSELHENSANLESSITSEITADKHNPREHTEPEVRGDHQSEDAVNIVDGQEVKQTQMLEMPQIEQSSERLIHDATENLKITSGDLTDQTEVSDTHQSELIMRSANDSSTNQEILNPDEKQDEHHTKENNTEALEHINEDYHVYDTKTPPISNIERVDTAFGQVYEMEGQLEDGMKPSVEQTGHQEREGVFSEMEESESSLQTLQSDTNARVDSQHQQNDTGFNPLGNRRKLGSSRRNRGRRHVKDSDAESYHEPTDEVVGNTRDNESLEKTEMSLTIETAVQEKTNETMLEGIDKFDTTEAEDVTGQVKENDHVVTLVGTDLHSSSTVDQQTIDQSNVREMPDEELPSSCSVAEKESKETDKDTELLKQSGILQTNYLMSEPHVKSRALESSITSEITTDNLSSREHTEPEVRGDHQSEDAESHMHEQEIKPAEIHEITSEMLIHDATENPENLTDQTDMSGTQQSEFILKITNDSLTSNEISSSESKQDEHHMKESNAEALEQKNEDYHVYDTKKATISDIERVDTAQGQVCEVEGQVEDDVKPSDEQTDHQEKEGLFDKMEESESSLQTLQSETNVPFDSQHQQNDTGFNPLENRRKLGSSRRNRGRRHVKDSDAESHHEPTEEVVGNTRDNKPLETSLTIETAVQEKTNETMLEGIDKLHTAETEDVGDQVKDNEHVVTLVGTDVHSSSTVDQQTMGQLNFREMPDEELPNVCSAPEIESKDRDKDTGLLRQDGNLQTNFLVSESRVESADLESSITAEITTDKHSQRKHTEIECIVEQAVFSSSKEDLSTDEEHKEPKVRGAHHLQDAVNEEEVKSTQVQEMHQIDNSSVMEIESSLQTLQSEMNTPLDSHPLDNSQSIKEQTQTGFSSTGNRRKLGSSRRNKGRLHVEDTTKISLVMETTRQEELKEQPGLDFKSAGEMRKIRSAVNDGENTDKIFAEDTLLSQNVMDNSTNLTRDIASSSGKHDIVKSNKEVSDEENKLMKECDHLNQLTGCDTVKTDLIQSPEVSVWKDDADIQSISYHDDSVTARLIASDALEQEEAFHVQNTEALPSDKEISMQKTNDTLETVRDVIIKDLSTGGEGSMYVQGSGQDEDREHFEDSMKKDHEDREINVELFSAEHSKTDAPSDIGLEEKLRAAPAMDVSEESGISSKQEKTWSETLQVEPKQRRRKMGSTRRSQLNRKPEEKRTETIDSDFNTEADMKNLDKRGVVEELPVTVAAEVSPSEKAKPSLSPASHNEEVVDPVKFVQVADVRESERNVDVSVEPSQIDDFTAIEVDIASVLAGDNSINPLLSPNTEDTTEESFVSLCETTQSAQNNEDRPESASVTNNQALKSAEQPDVAVLDIVKSEVRGGTGEEHLTAQASEEEPDNMNEGAHNKNPEGKNRRRKLGSSRRNLSSRTKREDLHQKQEVDDEATEAATNVGDVKTESLSGIIEDEEQLHVADKDIGSEERKETVFETEEHGHTGESQENPVSGGQLVETEHQPTPNDPSAISSSSPKQDSVSELASSGKRRKMGSHRKSHGHQNNENQTAGGDRITDTQNGQDVRGTRDQSAIKTTEELREKSLGLDKIPEVDESDKTPSSNISTSKEGEHSRPVSDKTPQPVTPIQHRSADIRLGQESQTKFSLAGNARAADLRSNAYNVMMIGDSSVGKTSFIKRAQSGKFSLDLPASVGLDSCMWTVVVEGKPVVLQLWDTAGQERFHSITRQIFRKAQAFLLMYDITCSQSFSAVSYWASCIQEDAAEDVMVLLVGNKSDCAKQQVKTQEAKSLAKEYNFEFMECSAATGENVVQSLETVARMLCQRDDTREEAIVLHKEPQKKKSSGCC